VNEVVSGSSKRVGQELNMDDSKKLDLKELDSSLESIQNIPHRGELDHDHDEEELDDAELGSHGDHDHSHSHSHSEIVGAFTAAAFAPEHDGSLASIPSRQMASGWPHPLLMFGCYKVGVIPASSAPSDAIATRPAGEVIADALKAGYRAFDCAGFYGNEKEIGEAIARSGIPRWELFFVSKVWTSPVCEGREAVKEAVRKTLMDLQISYLDAALVHWPVPKGKHVEAYKALEELYKEGRIRTLGISNYTIEDYEELEAAGISVKPSIAQLEISPWLYRPKTLDFFASKGMVLESYRTLKQGKGLSDPRVTAIATKHGKTPAQVVGRWCIQHGFAFMPKSQTPERMVENADVFGWELEESEMEALDWMTEPEAKKEWRRLYDLGVVRDTPFEGILDVVARSVTED
jgi:diketogulonate reductase-like aldo/keto reductase